MKLTVLQNKKVVMTLLKINMNVMAIYDFIFMYKYFQQN